MIVIALAAESGTFPSFWSSLASCICMFRFGFGYSEFEHVYVDLLIASGAHLTTTNQAGIEYRQWHQFLSVGVDM